MHKGDLVRVRIRDNGKGGEGKGRNAVYRLEGLALNKSDAEPVFNDFEAHTD